MRISIVGINLIMKYEGFSSKVYTCSGGRKTIGYGSTYYENGIPVKETDKPITIERGYELFINTLKLYEKIVQKNIRIELNQNQFDALVSHTYNTGGSNTLFRLVNEKKNEAIKNWFLTRYITANGKISKGLINRRKAECDLFFT